MIYNVTLGIRTAAQAAENAAARTANLGSARGGQWSAEANQRSRVIEIDPLHNEGGVRFEDFYAMVRVVTPFFDHTTASFGAVGGTVRCIGPQLIWVLVP